tara:strand:- start:234 stop:713 length:480 start_codon:yes stop_codon:yes gene_type:complete
MSNTILYSERQKFNQWWVWFSALLGPILLFFPLIGLILSGSSYIVLLLIFLLTFWLPIFLYRLHLDTEVNEKGIFIKFSFLHRNWVEFEYKDIESVEACIYKPVKHYGGWGIRYGAKGKAYNVTGNKGVLINFKDGTNILIGSLHYELLQSVLEERLNS